VNLKVRIERQVVEWLHSHPQVSSAFVERLNIVRSDELTLMRESAAVKFPGQRYMQRCFGFGGDYLAVFEWNHAERSIRVHTCQRVPLLPRAA
jgi:hypothetical protein